MASLSIASKQLHRQAMLQPRLALPAGRTVSLEEGRKLAKLVDEEDDRQGESLKRLVGQQTETPIVLEEKVSQRILLLRQKQNTAANISAAVEYAKRQQKAHKISSDDSAKVRDIALRVLRKEGSSSQVLKRRRARASGKKAAKSERN